LVRLALKTFEMGREPNYHLADFGQVESLQVIGQLGSPATSVARPASTFWRTVAEYDHGDETLAASPNARKGNQVAVA
jgi:hypothetical protein